MPAGMYGMLQAAGVCLPVGGGPVARGHLCGDECGRLRAKICVSDAESPATAHTAAGALSLPGGGRLRDPSGETGPVPDLPILARAGGSSKGMEENGGLLSGNRQRPADSNQKRAGAGRGNAAETPQNVPVGQAS